MQNIYFLNEKLINDESFFKSYTLNYLKKFFVNTLCSNVFGHGDVLSDSELDHYYNDHLSAGLIFSDIIRKIKEQKGKRELKSYLNALFKVLD